MTLARTKTPLVTLLAAQIAKQNDRHDRGHHVARSTIELCDREISESMSLGFFVTGPRPAIIEEIYGRTAH